jgi:hypothetical protein
MRLQPKHPESQPTVPDCTDLVTLGQRREKTRALKHAVIQELTGKTRLL